MKYLIISHILLISLLYSNDKVILFNNIEELVQWHDKQFSSDSNEKLTIDIQSMEVVEVATPKKLVIVDNQESDESAVLSLPDATIVSVEDVVEDHNLVENIDSKDNSYMDSLPFATIVKENKDEIITESNTTLVEIKQKDITDVVDVEPVVAISKEKVVENNRTVVKTEDKEEKDSIKITNYFEDDSFSKAQEVISTEVVDFWKLLDLTLMNSTALILKKHDIKITKENMELVKSEYYPNITLGYTSEYYHGYNRSSSATIGGSFYPGIKQFRDSVDLSLNYELYRFGATDLKVKMSEKDVEIVKSELALEKERISKELLGHYATALRAQNIIKYKEKIQFAQDRIIQKKWRLFEVGKVSKIELSKDQLSLVNLEKEISQQKQNFVKAVKNIQILSNIIVDPSKLKLAMLEPRNSEIKVFKDSAVAKNLRLTLQKKLQELELIKKDYMPTIYATSGYRLYGSGADYLNALESIEKNSWDIGVSLRWDVFNGYKTDKTVQKSRLEIQKIVEQYRLAKIDFEAKEIQRELIKKSIDKMLRVEAKILEQTHQQEEMLQRLQGVGKIDSIQLDHVEISKIRSELDFRLSVIDRVYESISSELII